MIRILAGALGVFGAFNALLGIVRAELDANIWWIDLRAVPEWVGRGGVLCLCGLLAAWAVWPQMQVVRKAATVSLAVCGIAACLWNAAIFYRLYFAGAIHTPLPVPFSFVIVLGLLAVLFGMLAPESNALVIAPWIRRLSLAGMLALCLIGFPLAQIFFFGKTDYRRSADAAVVFGARTYADGSLSLALSDRVRTACALKREGLVKTLIFSGGPGDGSVHETAAMRRFAMELGVPDDAIVLDPNGLNTRATLEFLRGWMKAHETRRVLAVSHFYHLPRIKLESQRLGIETLTVPARESRPLVKMPWLVAREVAALWKYYLDFRA